MNRVNYFRNRFRRGKETEAPACHAPRLGKAVDDDSVFLVRWREAGDTPVYRAIVKQVLINFVAHDEYTLLNADIAKRLDFVW